MTTQGMLNDMGYTDADGEPLKKDGKLGSKTRYAFQQFKKDQEARDQVAGDLWSDISGVAEAQAEEREQITVNPLNIKNLVTTKDLDSQLAVEKAGSEFGVTAGLNSDLPFDEGGLR